MVELNGNIQKQFMHINNLIAIRKRQLKILNKIFPLNPSRMIPKLESEENAFINRNISNIMETHYDMTSVCRHINDIFEIPALITAATNFPATAICAFFVINALDEIRNDSSFPSQLLSTFNPAFLFGQFVLMVSSFDDLATKVSAPQKITNLIN